MTADLKTNAHGTGKAPARITPKSQGRKLLHSPGIVAVSLYMLVLAFAVIVDVVKNHFPSLFLVFPVLFIAAGLGLLKLFRWAWALTLAAVAMFAGLFLLDYTSGRLFPSLAYGLLNLVIFLYLVRTEIRNKLR
jgi:uncharacterized membrane protein (DUF2068 family)